MKQFVFVSDFDGTLTECDFYQLLIDKHLGQSGQDLMARWQNREIQDFDFLAAVFQSVNRTEQEILDDILGIKLDPGVPRFIDRVAASNGDFIVLSAGTSYYIKEVFASLNIKNLHIISNPGIYEHRGIKLIRDHTSPFFSETYGIDKSLVVKDLKAKYQTVYYAGDSGPDLEAAILADTAFAKGKLQLLLEQRHHPYVPFESFDQIENYLVDKGVIINAQGTLPPYSDSEYPGSRQRYPVQNRRVN